MAEHNIAQATASRSPNKALWLATLEALEREFLAFQQGGAPRPCASASGTLTLIDADVKRAQELLLNLGG